MDEASTLYYADESYSDCDADVVIDYSQITQQCVLQQSSCHTFLIEMREPDTTLSDTDLAQLEGLFHCAQVQEEKVRLSAAELELQ